MSHKFKIDFDPVGIDRKIGRGGKKFERRFHVANNLFLIITLFRYISARDVS